MCLYFEPAILTPSWLVVPLEEWRGAAEKLENGGENRCRALRLQPFS